jgi:quercetin dioxygenase-like cupin family protein
MMLEAGGAMNRLIVALLFSISSFALAQTTPPRSVGKDLMTRDLPDCAGKEALMRANEYPPGTSNPPHRHNAHVFLHLLEGSLMVQVKDGEVVTLKPGDTYYEGPDDIHVVSRNPSTTVTAKALIFIIKNKGAPVTTLVQD